MTEITMDVWRGYLDDREEVTVEVLGDVTIGTMATYWDPAEPTEVEIIHAIVVASDHPSFTVGMTIELTPEETEQAELKLAEKAEDQGKDTGFEPPDPELPDND